MEEVKVSNYNEEVLSSPDMGAESPANEIENRSNPGPMYKTLADPSAAE